MTRMQDKSRLCARGRHKNDFFTFLVTQLTVKINYADEKNHFCYILRDQFISLWLQGKGFAQNRC